MISLYILAAILTLVLMFIQVYKAGYNRGGSVYVELATTVIQEESENAYSRGVYDTNNYYSDLYKGMVGIHQDTFEEVFGLTVEEYMKLGGKEEEVPPEPTLKLVKEEEPED